MEFFLTPTYVAQIIYSLGMIVAIVYLLARRNKSSDTRLILLTLVVLFAIQAIDTWYHITHTHLLQSGPAFEAAPYMVLAFWGTSAAFLICLTLIVYRLGFRFNIVEEWMVHGLNGVALLLFIGAFVLNIEDVSLTVSVVRTLNMYLLPVLGWLILAGARKLWTTYRTGMELRVKRLVLISILIMIAVFVMFNTASSLTVALALSAEVRGILPLLMSVAVTGLMVIGYLLYGSEEHSVLVKLIGFLLIACVALLSVVIPFMRTEISLRRAFLDPGQRESLVFSPDSLGGYYVEKAPAEWIEPSGKGVNIGDDSATLTTTEFAFPFYGSSYDSVWVGSNGSISFGQDIDADEVFSSGLSFYDDVPSAMIMYSDLIMAGTDARLIVDSTPERHLLTWYRISLYDLFESTNTMQAALYPDGRIQFNYLNLTTVPFVHFVGISPGGEAESMTFPEGVFHGGPGDAVFEWVSVRDAYRRFVHPLVVSALWVGIGTLFLLMLIGIVFYRAGIVRPLEKMLVGLRAVEKGDLDAEVVITERNELGALSDYFNSMTTSLREYSHKMEDLVARRTKDLDETIDNLKATQAQLVEQEKLASLGALTAGIAHEIKNPLNFVNNFAEVSGELSQEIIEALDAGKPEEARTLAAELTTNSEQITKHGKRADSIVRSMMQHARGGASEMETIDVNTYLEEYINLAWHGMRAHDDGFSTEIIRDFDPDVGTITAMPQELGRVVLNLLNNAFDALRGTEGAEVTVSTRALDSSVEISISDNGPGIPPEIREKIFEPFFTTKATGEGTGLGLSLSHDIVTKGLGGTLVVISTKGEGASFVATLPR